MKWYEKKFSEFFGKWKKGDLFLKSSKGYFGEIESFEVAERFEDSKIKFVCYEQSAESKAFPLKEIRHFHAQDGPILNIGKYVNIVKMEETRYLSVIDGGKSAQPDVKKKEEQKPRLVKAEGEDDHFDEDGEKIICIAFGLEFYTTEKKAQMLQQDIKRILFSKLEEVPVLSIDDRAPTDLTPTFSKWYEKLSLMRRRLPKHAGRKAVAGKRSRSIEEIKDPEGQTKT